MVSVDVKHHVYLLTYCVTKSGRVGGRCRKAVLGVWMRTEEKCAAEKLPSEDTDYNYTKITNRKYSPMASDVFCVW